MSDTLARVRAILTTTPQRWAQIIDAVPDSLIRERPVDGEWSAIECLQHIIDTERLFYQRLEALRREQDIAAFDPDSQGTQSATTGSPSALAAEFVELRAASLSALAQVSEEEFSLHARHSELGIVTVGQLLHEWAAHDLAHTMQAERALMQPFILGCGPWQIYFAEHLIDPTAQS